MQCLASRKDPEIQGNRTHDEKSKLKLLPPEYTSSESVEKDTRKSPRDEKGVNAPGEHDAWKHTPRNGAVGPASEFRQHAETHSYNQQSKQASRNNLQDKRIENHQRYRKLKTTRRARLTSLTFLEHAKLKAKRTFFSSLNRLFPQVDHTLGCTRRRLNKFYRIQAARAFFPQWD